MIELPQQQTLPPTPTPYIPPPDVEIVNMPELSLWDSAPMAVGFWNEMQPHVILFQALVIIFLVGMLIMMITRIINRETME
ncbi:MAG: hypothetical protein AAFV33_11110 [Chloroflexota bacterium]